MKKLFSIASLCAAAVLALGVAAPAAKATTVTATWTGTIRDGNDGDGSLFGGALDAGTAFTLKSVFSTPPGTYDPANGGSITGGGGQATLTVNSQSYTFDFTPASFGLDQYGSIKLAIGDTNSTFITAAFYPLTSLTDILVPFDGDCYDTAGGYCSGSFEVVPQYAGASFDATHLNIAIATTPIPAALPLFASALLGLGAIGWRRKATTAA